MGIPVVANVSAADDASVTSEIMEASEGGKESSDNEEEDSNSVVTGIKIQKDAVQERTNQMRWQQEVAK
eukprot:12095894-Ditylum_brightwellii.AAC.1